jgi:hypothetical protein
MSWQPLGKLQARSWQLAGKAWAAEWQYPGNKWQLEGSRPIAKIVVFYEIFHFYRCRSRFAWPQAAPPTRTSITYRIYFHFVNRRRLRHESIDERVTGGSAVVNGLENELGTLRTRPFRPGWRRLLVARASCPLLNVAQERDSFGKRCGLEALGGKISASMR